jgi:hypothetical protein
MSSLRSRERPAGGFVTAGGATRWRGGDVFLRGLRIFEGDFCFEGAFEFLEGLDDVFFLADDPFWPVVLFPVEVVDLPAII